uniref:Occludin n=1 Tax=Marmota marmota marmota TaxID=9994 RepID=A0A8C5YPJ0_MARMA
MSSRPFESPPPYRPDEFKPNHYAPSNDIYGGEMHVRPMLSQPAYSFYPEDEILHFYKWTSPPGVIRILSMLVIMMCIAIFACVASTLAWDRGYGTGLLGGYCHCARIHDYCGFCFNNFLCCENLKKDGLV